MYGVRVSMRVGKLSSAVLSVIFLAFSSTSVAAADLDIRTSSSLGANDQSASYVLSVSDCGSVSLIQAGAPGAFESFASENTIRDLEHPSLCSVSFTIDGPMRGQPVAKVTYSDGRTVEHSETFRYEDQGPTLRFGQASITGESGKQHLVTTVEAGDNTDLQYVGFQVAGLRASDIRAAGGVIAEARRDAFAQTNGVQRVYPRRNDQSEFSLSIPVVQALSNEAIAQDVIVLVDAFAVDASGNQTVLSKIAFTGDSIQEAAKALVVSSSKIVINNILQTPVLQPSVEFQFRGLVDLSGPGNGISYESTHPELVGVTGAGVIYALAETGTEPVAIRVSFPGLEPAEVPVEVDFSKVLTGLELKGYQAGQPFELERLNAFYKLPELE